MKSLHFLPSLVFLCAVALIFPPVFHAGAEDEDANPPKAGELAETTDVDFDALRRELDIKPIAVKPEADTTRKALEQLHAWYVRMILEPAKERLKGEPYAEDALKFLHDSVEWRTTTAPAAEKMFEQPAILWGAGCRDPSVLFMSAIAIEESSTAAAASGYYEWAIKACDRPNLPRAIGALAALHLIKGPGRGDAALKSQLLALVDEAFRDGSYTEEEAPILVYQWFGHFGSSFGEEGLAAVAKSVERGKMPEWARLALLGDLEVDRAWAARGGGWASTVTPEGWKGFERHLDLARKRLTRAWEMQPDRPEAAGRMLAVEMGAGGDDVLKNLRLWFDRATAARFDYTPAYDSMFRAMLPRWHGSYGHLLAFGDACLQTKRWDTEIPDRFLKVLRDIADEIPDWRPLYRQPAIASRVRELNEHLIEKHQHPSVKKDWEAMRAAYAYICGDEKLAAELLPKASFPKNSGALNLLNRLGVGLTAAVSESLILAGPGRESFLAAREHREAKHWGEARIAYTSARKQSPERAGPYLDGEIALVDFEEGFTTGAWTPLPLRKGHPGWDRLTGTWTTDDGRFICKGANEASRMVFGGKIDGDFEARGHFAFTGFETVHHSFCFIFDHSPLPAARNAVHWASAQVWQVAPHPARAVLQSEFYAPRKDGDKVVTFDKEADFRVRREGRRISFWINDQEVFKDYQIFPGGREPPNLGTSIGLGEFRLGSEANVEFSKLEIRKLGKGL